MKMAMLDLKRLVLGLVLCGLAAFARGGSVADGARPAVSAEEVPAQVAEAVPIATDKRAGSFSASTPTATSTGCGSWTAARTVAS